MKNKYYQNSKLEDEQKIKIEEIKFQNLTNEQKNKITSKAEAIILEAKDSEVTYIHQITYTNTKREKHIQLLIDNLNEFQIIEENYTESIKDSLRKFNIYQVACVRNLQYDLDKQGKVKSNLNEINESINCKADITSFIKKNSQQSNFPTKIEFIPYSAEINMNIQKPTCNNFNCKLAIFGSMKEFFNTTINSIKKNVNFSFKIE